MKTGEILKSIRIENGLTQKELGERLKIGQATIACYENGQREPHICNLVAYADFFGCSVDFLIGRTDDFGNPVLKKPFGQKETLTEEELVLLKKYHGLSTREKTKLEGYIDGLLNK